MLRSTTSTGPWSFLLDPSEFGSEELTLNVMSAEVTLVMARMASREDLAPPKVSRSIENSFHYLDENVDAVLAALPGSRAFSFVEVALFCLVTHLPFRRVMDVSSWARLGELCARFGERESARSTEYCFDAPPPSDEPRYREGPD